jgi:hypothetical protein
MSNKQMIEVQQGVWIEKRWLQSAGLGSHLQVIVQPGEIRIVAAPPEMEAQNVSEKGRNVFRSLGNNAPGGKLQNAAVEHDRYLYGKGQ